MVFISSVLQFHHHDCDGNICIALSPEIDLTIYHSESKTPKCQHVMSKDEQEHSHGGCNHNSDTEDQCIIRIDDFQVSKQSSIVEKINTYSFVLSCIVDWLRKKLLVANNNSEIHIYKDVYIPPIILEHHSLRAPPYYC